MSPVQSGDASMYEITRIESTGSLDLSQRGSNHASGKGMIRTSATNSFEVGGGGNSSFVNRKTTSGAGSTTGSCPGGTDTGDVAISIHTATRISLSTAKDHAHDDTSTSSSSKRSHAKRSGIAALFGIYDDAATSTSSSKSRTRQSSIAARVGSQ